MKNIFIISLFVGSTLLANSLQEIKEQKIIKIGIRSQMPPYVEITPDGEYKGFEIDLSKKIAKSILGENAKIEFITISAKERLEVLKNNKVDMVVAYSKTPAREKLLDFSLPYMSSTISVISWGGII